jgi:hypothetical protein
VTQGCPRDLYAHFRKKFAGNLSTVASRTTTAHNGLAFRFMVGSKYKVLNRLKEVIQTYACALEHLHGGAFRLKRDADSQRSVCVCVATGNKIPASKFEEVLMDKGSEAQAHSSVKSYMVTTERSKDQAFTETQAAVVHAFDAVCQTEPSLIRRFHESFNERSTLPEFEESRGCDGMRAVVSSILWKVVPEEYLKRQISTEKTNLDNHFVNCLRTAIGELSSTHPYILRDLKRYKERTGLKYETIIGGQLAFEIDNKRACPY